MKITSLLLMILMSSITSFCQQQKNANKVIEPTPDCCNDPHDPMITLVPKNQSACPGSKVAFLANAFMAEGTYWQMSVDNGITWLECSSFAPASGSNSDTLTISPVTTQMNNYLFRCYYGGSCCGKAITPSASLSVIELPIVINNQPKAISACRNNTVDFSIGVTGGSLSYQWQQSIDSGGHFNNLPGRTADLLHFDSVTLDMNGFQYRCVVNSECAPSVISTPAILAVRNERTSITSQITDITACANDTSIFTIGVAGNLLKYQWQLRNGHTGIFEDLKGDTLRSLTVNRFSAPKYDYDYRCIVASSCSTAYSNVAKVHYLPVPVALAATDLYVCEDASASIPSFIMEPTPADHFQWQVSTNGGDNFTNIAGDTLVQKFITATAEVNNYKYRCYLDGLCFKGFSNPIAIRSDVPTSITHQPTDQTICVNFPVTFSVKAFGPITNFRWQKSTDGGLTFFDFLYYEEGNPFDSSYTFIPHSISFNNYKYRCRIYSNCFPDVYSEAVTLNLLETPEAGENQVITVTCDTCRTNIAGLFNTTSFALVQWNTPDTANALAGKYSLKVFNNNGCYDSAVAFVNVKSADTLKVCGAGMVSLESNILGTKYQWEWKIAGGAYFNIYESYNNHGTTTPYLTISSLPFNAIVRCRVDSSRYSSAIYLKNTAFWNGNADSNWNNPLNWNCGIVPDLYTDVTISPNGKYLPVINADAECKRLVLNKNSTISVLPGKRLLVGKAD